jgi:hypothetical protein
MLPKNRGTGLPSPFPFLRAMSNMSVLERSACNQTMSKAFPPFHRMEIVRNVRRVISAVMRGRLMEVMVLQKKKKM